MDKHSDLPLFRWTPPPVEVIPFPTRRRVGKIRQAARGIIDAPTGKAEAGFWIRITRAMETQMRKAGVSEDRITRELADFFDATQREIDRQLAAVRNLPANGGGDAA